MEKGLKSNSKSLSLSVSPSNPENESEKKSSLVSTMDGNISLNNLDRHAYQIKLTRTTCYYLNLLLAALEGKCPVVVKVIVIFINNKAYYGQTIRKRSEDFSVHNNDYFMNT